MLIEINDSDRFTHIVAENSNDQNKMYYATRTNGTSVGNNPAPYLIHRYLYLTTIGAFYHASKTNNVEPKESPIKFENDVVITNVKNISIDKNGKVSIT